MTLPATYVEWCDAARVTGLVVALILTALFLRLFVQRTVRYGIGFGINPHPLTSLGLTFLFADCCLFLNSEMGNEGNALDLWTPIVGLTIVLIGMGFATAAALVLGTTLAACSDDADVASDNLSKDADNFKIVRRIVFLNGITDKYLLTIEGRCAIDDDGDQLEVTCKLGDDQFKKHFLGLSDNVTYFIEQVESADVSTDFYKVTFKPSVLVPDVDAR